MNTGVILSDQRESKNPYFLRCKASRGTLCRRGNGFFDFAMLRSERPVLLLLPMKVGGKRKAPSGEGADARYYFVSALAALRASLVLQNFSRTGTRMMHTKIAVKPPLYRQKPPCRPGTRVTRQ